MVALAVGSGKAFTGLCLAACGAALGVLASGCGEAEQDAHEQKATYRMEVVAAHFPAKQSIASDTNLVLVVRNASASTVPNVAVSLNSLNYTSDYPHLSADKRPVWIVNRAPGATPLVHVLSEEVYPPGGSETADVNTWALGPLAPKASRVFVWHVTPVKAGTYTVYYTVAAGLNGRSKARVRGGGPVIGKFVVKVAPRPPQTHVNPQTGKVEEGSPPVSKGPVEAVQ